MTHTGAPSAGAAGFQIRPAREEDLDVIVRFEWGKGWAIFVVEQGDFFIVVGIHACNIKL